MQFCRTVMFCEDVSVGSLIWSRALKCNSQGTNFGTNYIRDCHNYSVVFICTAGRSAKTVPDLLVTIRRVELFGINFALSEKYVQRRATISVNSSGETENSHFHAQATL